MARPVIFSFCWIASTYTVPLNPNLNKREPNSRLGLVGQIQKWSGAAVELGNLHGVQP